MRKTFVPFFVIPGVIFSSVLSSVVSTASNAHAITIEDAYKSIPHKQTTYQKSLSTLSKEDAADLEEFFHVVDLAIVNRVEALQALRTSRGRVEKQMSELRRLGQRLREFKVPDAGSDVPRIVGDAVMDEFNYLQSIVRGNRQDIQGLAGDLRVQSASEKLKRAYSMLMKAFPAESEQNKQAFYDHLCALDFL